MNCVFRLETINAFLYLFQVNYTPTHTHTLQAFSITSTTTKKVTVINPANLYTKKSDVTDSTHKELQGDLINYVKKSERERA